MEKTFYTIEDLEIAIEAIKKTKMIAVKAQDYTTAAQLRDAEKRMTMLLEIKKDSIKEL